jgi:hypothetical protein
MKYTELLFFKLFIYCWPKYKYPAKFFLKNTPYSLKKLSLAEFLDLNIMPEGEIHWRSRARHLNFVTDNGKYKKIGKIVDHLSSELSKLEYLDSIIETPTDTPFKQPGYPRRKFWRLGNNFFIYNILYGFRKNVLPYKEVDQYIIAGKKPDAYTKEYYLSLDIMDEKEISALLKKYPILVEDNAVRNGRHRVFALMGRIINQQSYIPIYTLQSSR